MAITFDPNISMSQTSNVYADASVTAADKLASQIESATSDDDTLQACKDFESYMLEQIFKSMENTAKIWSDDEDEGDNTAQMYMDNFKDTYYQEIVSQMMSAGQGVGIAEQLYQSITNQKLGISADTTTAEAAAKEAAQKASEATPAQTAAELTGAAAVAAASSIAASTM